MVHSGSPFRQSALTVSCLRSAEGIALASSCLPGVWCGKIKPGGHADCRLCSWRGWSVRGLAQSIRRSPLRKRLPGKGITVRAVFDSYRPRRSQRQCGNVGCASAQEQSFPLLSSRLSRWGYGSPSSSGRIVRASVAGSDSRGPIQNGATGCSFSRDRRGQAMSLFRDRSHGRIRTRRACHSLLQRPFISCSMQLSPLA